MSELVKADDVIAVIQEVLKVVRVGKMSKEIKWNLNLKFYIKSQTLVLNNVFFVQVLFWITKTRRRHISHFGQ